jgi:hypothetical protein
VVTGRLASADRTHPLWECTFHIKRNLIKGRAFHTVGLRFASLPSPLTSAMFPSSIQTSDEETPLLQKKKVRGRTPLPKFQIGIILLLQICEPLTSQSIYPYINQVWTRRHSWCKQFTDSSFFCSSSASSVSLVVTKEK